LPLIAARINASKLKLIDCYLVKNTKLRRRRERRKEKGERRKDCLEVVVGGYLAKAAKALVVSEPIAIFHPRDGKS
jgi:hypothetical protein